MATKHYFFTFFIFLSCDQNSAFKNDENLVLQSSNNSTIIGKWQVDSTVFINSGTDGDYDYPILPTFWTFNEDGKFKVENNNVMKGSFVESGNILNIELMGISTQYEMLTCNSLEMILLSTIYENENASLKNKSHLSKISN